MWVRLAQRLEHRICNAMIFGSIPITCFSLFIFDFLHDWWKYPFLKSNEYSKTFLLFQRLLNFLFSYRNFQLCQEKFIYIYIIFFIYLIERVLDISIIHLILLFFLVQNFRRFDFIYYLVQFEFSFILENEISKKKSI